MIRWELENGFDDETITRSRRAYFGAVSYIDHQVGRLVRLLEELSLRDNTVIIFTSDHGELLGERGLWFKRHFFEPAAAVPLIISAPGGLWIYCQQCWTWLVTISLTIYESQLMGTV